MPIWATKINGRRYELEVGPGRVDVAFDKENKTFALFWVRNTQFKNIIWMRITSIGWRWPPIKWAAAFTDG